MEVEGPDIQVRDERVQQLSHAMVFEMCYHVLHDKGWDAAQLARNDVGLQTLEQHPKGDHVVHQLLIQLSEQHLPEAGSSKAKGGRRYTQGLEFTAAAIQGFLRCGA